MAKPTAPGAEPTQQACHGDRSEVSWDSGKGRHPYGNQGSHEAPPAAAGEVEGGDRAQHSGQNLDQLDQVKRKP